MGVLAVPGPSLTPSSTKTITQSNYISVYDMSTQFDPAKQKELQMIYGNQSITGLLELTSSEAYFEADKAYWGEEGRLFTNYNDVTRSGSTFTKIGHNFRVGEVVSLSDASAKNQARIKQVPNANTFVASPYTNAGFTIGTTGITAFVIGSEFPKGSDGMNESLNSGLSIYSNKPVIMKDVVIANGSDVTSVDWVETAEGGYYWFLKNQFDTELRMNNKAEMMCLMGELAEAGSQAELDGAGGTEGLFSAISKRGNIFQGVPTTVADFDDIVSRFDKEGKIENYTMYVDKQMSNAFDDMLGALNAGYANGISYGIFPNGEEMSVNLGFSALKRGGYNFFKKSYRLLDDPTLLGSVATTADKVRGIFIPMGTKEVYDGMDTSARKIQQPFLHVKYRGNQNDNRRMKTWALGSVGAARTSSVDAREIHYLSERMLCTTAPNNFLLCQGN